jgi:beta-glucanase (GH16 family)
MNKRLFSLALGLGISLSTVLQTVPVQAAAIDGTHELVQFDSKDSVDYSVSKWANGGNFDCTWAPSEVNMENSQMRLSINKGANGYIAGEYSTKKYYGYGFYQVSMKPIKNTGVVSSFFSYVGNNPHTKSDEIDIEFLGYDTTKVQFNYFTNGRGGHEYLYNLGFDASEAFHTYGYYWAPGSITWYVDGQPVYTATKDIPDTPGKIMMSAWPGKNMYGWIRNYDGKTNISAYYDWFSYDAIDGVAGGSYFDSFSSHIVFNAGSQKALEVDNKQNTNGSNAFQSSYTSAANQKWFFIKSGNYYLIRNAATGKYLSVADSSKQNGANVYQWDLYGGANQLWSITPVNGAYKIVNANSGKSLNAAIGNGNVEQNKNANSSLQVWYVDSRY